MHTLITGGAGFLGSNLALYLLGKGHKVTVVDNLITGEVENLSDFKNNANFSFVRLGVEEEQFFEMFVSAPAFDRIYHLACPTGVPNIDLLGEEMMITCSAGTRNVLELARAHRSRILFTSSSEIYGDPLRTPQDEGYTGNVDPTGPRAPYEEGKRFAESLVALYHKKYHVKARIVRLFNVYGPKMSMRDTRVIPRFFQQALAGDPLTVHDDGTQRRTLCYVTDVIRGLALVMEEGSPDEIYNLGSDKEITMLALARKIVSLTSSQSKTRFVEGVAFDHKRRMPSLLRVFRLGWRETTSLDKGLRATLAFFEERYADYVERLAFRPT